MKDQIIYERGWNVHASYQDAETFDTMDEALAYARQLLEDGRRTVTVYPYDRRP